MNDARTGRIRVVCGSRIWLTVDRHDLGLDHSHDRHTMCCLLHGGIVLFYADEWGTILCCCSPGSTRLWTFCSLDYWME